MGTNQHYKEGFSKNNGVFDKSYALYKGPNQDRVLISDFPNSSNGVVSLDDYKMREVKIKSVNFGNNNYELQKNLRILKVIFFSNNSFNNIIKITLKLTLVNKKNFKIPI